MVVVVGVSVVASETVVEPSCGAGVVSAASLALAMELANQLMSVDPTEANAEGGGSVETPSVVVVVGVSVVVVGSSVGAGAVSSSCVIQL